VKVFKQRAQDDEAPDMLWSHDGRYLARLEKDVTLKVELIKVYEAPSFGLVGGASIKAAGAASFSWAPKGAPLLAWWCPERENKGTSVDVVSLPSKEVVRHRTLFNIDKVALVWHPDGTHLAVVATKAVRRRKGKDGKEVPSTANAGVTVEVLRLGEKGVPVETLDLKDRVRHVSFEGNGTRLAIVTGDGPSDYTISFYKCVWLAA
jgi:translation initiation factor 3 subunit B